MKSPVVPAVPPRVLLKVPEELSSERLVLLSARAGFGQAVCAAVVESFDQLQPWMPWCQERPTVEGMEAVVRQMQARFILREDLCYYFFRRGEDGRPGRLLGGCGLHRMDWDLRRFEIGYWVRSTAQGQGYVSEMVQLLGRLAFEQLRARRLEIRCDARNARSRAVAERNGFQLEAVLRHGMLSVDAEPADQCLYTRWP
ncbi:GNAT family N-acetyltransferase [Mitsuaria sp. WAJ17]|uniref:GNAT family N-acetyltransferase n=1 Tax=Mitsuaria sp. WAJ17 TaxID=2761452 RepID=UPI0015FF08FB|nr:GNAT family N-acetyltransferase [Mitsuaria sp. WAJ17]MBB2484291.1 GNAT family N-acetyltransferase [Mitsuaria sp. WAJ17]